LESTFIWTGGGVAIMGDAQRFWQANADGESFADLRYIGAATSKSREGGSHESKPQLLSGDGRNHVAAI
jgi:hypothetical protein